MRFHFKNYEEKTKLEDLLKDLEKECMSQSVREIWKSYIHIKFSDIQTYYPVVLYTSEYEPFSDFLNDKSHDLYRLIAWDKGVQFPFAHTCNQQNQLTIFLLGYVLIIRQPHSSDLEHEEYSRLSSRATIIAKKLALNCLFFSSVAVDNGYTPHNVLDVIILADEDAGLPDVIPPEELW